MQPLTGRYTDFAIQVRARALVCVQYVITDLPSLIVYSKANNCFSNYEAWKCLHIFCSRGL